MNKKESNFIIHVCTLIGLSFLWTECGYLSWLYHMMDVSPTLNADLLSEGVGYLFQVAGLILYGIIIRKNSSMTENKFFSAAIYTTDFVMICLATLFNSTTLVLIFGYLMNLFHGAVAGVYLSLMVKLVPQQRRGIVFGGGYAIGTVGTWIISIISNDNYLKNNNVLFIYGIMVLVTVCHCIFLSDKKNSDTEMTESDMSGRKKSLIILACILVFTLSLAKGLGFFFPMADISSGKISLEFSRLFYAAGLILAGLLNDYKRRYGLVACVASMIFPFILLVLTDKIDTSIIVWIISYTFTGFYTVYRILLLSDFAKSYRLMYLAGFGLIFGRLGDAAGTSLGIAFGSNLTFVIVISVVVFVTTIVMACIMFEKLYFPNIFPANDMVSIKKQAIEDIHNDIPSAACDMPDSEPLYTVENFANEYALSKREIEVLALALTNMKNTSIAAELFISDNTTKFHIRNILKKTGCANRNELKALFKSKNDI